MIDHTLASVIGFVRLMTHPKPDVLADRSPHASHHSAGNLLFHSRRWLDPRNPADRALLEFNHGVLCSSFPHAFADSSVANFLYHIGTVSETWSKRLAGSPQAAVRRPRSSPHALSLPTPSFPAPSAAARDEPDLVAPPPTHFDEPRRRRCGHPAAARPPRRGRGAPPASAATAGAAPLNAGEDVDLRLHEHWPSLRAGPDDLEGFGRSRSPV
jgi:hypothetical protein